MGTSGVDKAILDNAFVQARSKINRAYRHFQEANGLFRLYLESDFCKLLEERNPETGDQSFRVEAAPIQADMVLAIGDAFHNLSCALDYIMTGMMRAAGVSAIRVGFPTDVTRQALRKSFMAPKPGKKGTPNRRIVETFPAFVILILQNIRPYRGGNFLLWEIRKADNLDKHNLIVPAVTVTKLENISLLDEKYRNQFSNVTVQVGAGGRLNLLHYANGDGEMKITNTGRASANISFSQNTEVFANQPVFPTLLQCIQSVDTVARLIEDAAIKPFERNVR